VILNYVTYILSAIKFEGKFKHFLYVAIICADKFSVYPLLYFTDLERRKS